jgi:hypothetical protein
MPTRAVLTYSDYAALPDDGRHYELHRGELSVTPAPGTRHQEAYWIADPDSRSVEEYALAGADYALAGRVTSDPAALPPLSRLMLDPASIWS